MACKLGEDCRLCHPATQRPAERLAAVSKATPPVDARRALCAPSATSRGPESVLEEAQRLIYGERRDSYSHPLDDYECTGRMWGALLERAGWTPPPDAEAVTPELACLMMVAVKMSREAHVHKRDNNTDGAGYFGCVQEIHEERTRREEVNR